MSQKTVNKLKKEILITASNAGDGHIASAFSILDILWVLYAAVLKVDPRNPAAPERDRFVLSKGHGSLALYAVLAEKKFFKKDELSRFEKFNAILGGHPDRNKVPGVEASTGSLGHGLPMAVGIALGLRIQKNPARVFCLIGDGETNEGTIWESLLLAAKHRLFNLTIIIDDNKSTDRALGLGDLKAKLESFGFKTFLVDGHHHADLKKALLAKSTDRPLVIMAKTVKGRGIKEMENKPEWHRRAPTKEELDGFLKQVR